MAELQPNIVFNGRHFVRHIGICNSICVKLLQVMSGVILHNLQKNDVSISSRSSGVHQRGTHTQTHTHTHTHIHDDSIRRNAMRCISPNKMSATNTRRNSNRFSVRFSSRIPVVQRAIAIEPRLVDLYIPTFA